MSLAIIHSRALDGFIAAPVTVEVQLANGLPCFTLVGLADTEVREARERVRSALAESGLEFPMNKRITVNLAPADVPKESGRFDLPIAIGILAASGQVDSRLVERFEFAGELSLAGVLRPVRGALAMAYAVSRLPPGASLGATTAQRALVLPATSASEAALIRRAEVWGADTLADVVLAFAPGSNGPQTATVPNTTGLTRAQPASFGVHPDPAERAQAALAPDLADVRGHPAAKRALEVAAAGGHHVLLIGPPGTGKSMLAQRLPGLLPPMTEDEAVEAAAVASLASAFDLGRFGRRPFRAPHHSASAVALVGGGSPPRPGEISLAHHGVLFLDELPEFNRAALEALREPLETGQITIARAARRAEFPARFQLVAALNPCPCGHAGNPLQACRCTPDVVARYQSRVSGPLLERVDLIVEVPVQVASTFATTTSAAVAGAASADATADTTAAVARRVASARTCAVAAQGVSNARLDAARLLDAAMPTAAAERLLATAATRLGWSARSLHRVWRVARTIADIDAVQASPERTQAGEPGAAPRGPVDVAHVAEAIQYRRGLTPPRSP